MPRRIDITIVLDHRRIVGHPTHDYSRCVFSTHIYRVEQRVVIVKLKAVRTRREAFRHFFLFAGRHVRAATVDLRCRAQAPPGRRVVFAVDDKLIALDSTTHVAPLAIRVR